MQEIGSFLRNSLIKPIFGFCIIVEPLFKKSVFHGAKQLVSEGSKSGEYSGEGSTSQRNVSRVYLTNLVTCEPPLPRYEAILCCRWLYYVFLYHSCFSD